MDSDWFPVTHSIFSAEAVSAEIAQAYGIDTPVSCQFLRRGLNDTYLVTMQDERYVARVYRARWRSWSEIAYELELLAHLAAKGVSVSVSIPSRDGTLCCPISAPEGIRYLALFTYAQGTPMPWDETLGSLAGRLLAAIHAASKDFVSQHARCGLDLDFLIDGSLAAIRPVVAHRPEDWRYLEALGTRLRDRVEAVAAGLDWGVCHGDFGANNIHIGEDRRPTAFDFDFCGPGWLPFDFVTVWWSAMGRKRSGLWDAFLKGYGEVKPVTETDLAAVSLFRAVRHLWGMGLRSSCAAYRGTASLDSGYLDYRLASFRKWEAEHLQVG